MDGWIDARTDKPKSPCVLQDFVPFGAAALLPLTLIHNQCKARATGIADHILPLGDLFRPYCLDLGYLAEFGSEKAPKETRS